MKRTAIVILVLLAGAAPVLSQDSKGIPPVHSNIHRDASGEFFVQVAGRTIYPVTKKNPFTLTQMRGNPSATADGIAFDFDRDDFEGTLYFGFVAYGDSKHPMPVYFHTPAKIESGQAVIAIEKDLGGLYDMVGWQKTGRGVLGYRVVSHRGRILHDGRVGFKTGSEGFEIDVTVLEGPFVNLLHPGGATFSFTTNMAVVAEIDVAGQVFFDKVPVRQHEIAVSGLAADSSYSYAIRFGDNSQTFHFRTAPLPGSRKPFVFSYCSDSRSGQGGGERDVHGANAYIMKKIMALTTAKGARFCQFTGDLITGYLTDPGEMHLQYANWKRAVEPFAHQIPIVAGFGNHEVFVTKFEGDGIRARVDRFPHNESSEALFAANFVNPRNGPDSEDGSIYDPNPATTDFPSYAENVFYYTYDNVAIVSLNSDYWYTPDQPMIAVVGGNPHGYVMDKQLSWLKKTLAHLQADANIDHIFVTIHTPFFPNGGHVKDDMWWRGNNNVRPFVAGKPVKAGIIERRDQLLDMIVNNSPKVAAILTGDEHNYNKLLLQESTPRYPEGWKGKRLRLSRSIYQINNGAAGAPYYAQEETPWSADVSGFTTQNALVFFHVDDAKVEVEVLNPDTLEEVDRFTLK